MDVTMGVLLIFAGTVQAAVGGARLAGERPGLGRLPGDIAIGPESRRNYVSLMFSAVLSLTGRFPGH